MRQRVMAVQVNSTRGRIIVEGVVKAPKGLPRDVGRTTSSSLIKHHLQCPLSRKRTYLQLPTKQQPTLPLELDTARAARAPRARLTQPADLPSVPTPRPKVLVSLHPGETQNLLPPPPSPREQVVFAPSAESARSALPPTPPLPPPPPHQLIIAENDLSIMCTSNSRLPPLLLPHPRCPTSWRWQRPTPKPRARARRRKASIRCSSGLIRGRFHVRGGRLGRRRRGGRRRKRGGRMRLGLRSWRRRLGG
ncbi:hypothetical protein BCR35DRAFT_299924 [Leucosporidium creatinivorum]|uniref:Uncharacterized protein n=1 Tax=Leucosporidium creatinivorum TaxID=106004 RepID=A0A1Y2G0Z4_9BASI|nr:hypothetical protein BCR35DRAFT_299924 [Leucosporidium creatinivorum]